MKKIKRHTFWAIAPVGVLAIALSACSGQGTASNTSSVDPDAPVTISVSNQPPATQPAQLAAYKKTIADFEKAYPNITVKGTETSWNASTFQAQLAGKQLPTVMTVPFTEPQGLIARKQVADITNELEQVKIKDKLNPSALPIGQDKSGKIYGVPVDAYALGLMYNRDLFTQAGLDPDKPPTTWNEVRKDARIVAEKTNAAGYGQMTTGGQGGWTLTAMSYSAGGTIENSAGTKATFTDTPQATQKQLQLLHDMRWVDDSMGSNFSYDQAGILKDFAAGKIGMIIAPPVSYTFCTTLFAMDGTTIGLTSMPQGAKAGGSLSGGALDVVMPNATAAQRLAAVKFIAFQLNNYKDKADAVAYAKSLLAQGKPVGLPGLSPVKASYNEQYLKWVKDYVNVPLDNFKGYNDTINKIDLKPEPTKKAQEVYSALDPVVQAVLTKKDAEIPSLLSTAKNNVDTLLQR